MRVSELSCGITSHRKLVVHSSLELVFTLFYSEVDISGGLHSTIVICRHSVCDEHGALYHYGGPQSASDIGTPGTPQIASVIGRGASK